MGDEIKAPAAPEREQDGGAGEATQGGARADEAPESTAPESEAADKAVEFAAESSVSASGSGRRKLRLELDNKDPDYKNSKEKIYDFLADKLHLSVRVMDVVIVILVLLMIAFLVIGFMKGDGGYIA